MSRLQAMYECIADTKILIERPTKVGIITNEREFKKGDLVAFEDLRYWFGYIDTNYFQYKVHGAVPA